MTKEVAVINNYNLAPVDGNFMEVFKEEMDGLGSMPIDTVKIPSGGGVAFEVPSEDPDSPDMVKELVGIIVGHKPQNAYWSEAFTGANASPDCFSDDGKTGLDSRTGEIRDCASCPYNQYGSAVNANGQPTRGKACKNLHRLYFLTEGSMFPVIINLPPTSIKSFKDYLAKRLLLRGKRSYQVLTKITLKKASSGDGIPYSQCVFTKAGDLSPGVVKELEPFIALTKELMNAPAQPQPPLTLESEDIPF